MKEDLSSCNWVICYRAAAADASEKMRRGERSLLAYALSLIPWLRLGTDELTNPQ